MLCGPAWALAHLLLPLRRQLLLSHLLLPHLLLPLRRQLLLSHLLLSLRRQLLLPHLLLPLRRQLLLSHLLLPLRHHLLLSLCRHLLLPLRGYLLLAHLLLPLCREVSLPALLLSRELLLPALLFGELLLPALLFGELLLPALLLGRELLLPASLLLLAGLLFAEAFKRDLLALLGSLSALSDFLFAEKALLLQLFALGVEPGFALALCIDSASLLGVACFSLAVHPLLDGSLPLRCSLLRQLLGEALLLGSTALMLHLALGRTLASNQLALVLARLLLGIAFKTSSLGLLLRVPCLELARLLAGGRTVGHSRRRNRSSGAGRQGGHPMATTSSLVVVEFGSGPPASAVRSHPPANASCTRQELAGSAPRQDRCAQVAGQDVLRRTEGPGLIVGARRGPVGGLQWRPADVTVDFAPLNPRRRPLHIWNPNPAALKDPAPVVGDRPTKGRGINPDKTVGRRFPVAILVGHILGIIGNPNLSVGRSFRPGAPLRERRFELVDGRDSIGIRLHVDPNIVAIGHGATHRAVRVGMNAACDQYGNEEKRAALRESGHESSLPDWARHLPPNTHTGAPKMLPRNPKTTRGHERRGSHTCTIRARWPPIRSSSGAFVQRSKTPRCPRMRSRCERT